MGGCVRMNSDDDFPIRKALPVGLGSAAGLGFPEKLCTIGDTIYLNDLYPFP